MINVLSLTKEIILSTTLIGLVLFSCDNHEKNYSNEPQIDTYDKEIVLNQDVIDRNLKRDLRIYNDAFYDGDADLASKYVYPPLYSYLRNEFPEEDFTVEDSKELMRKTITSLKESFISKGIEVEIKIGDIISRAEYQKDLIYTARVYVVAKNDLDEYSIGGEVIGISTDGGRTWKFIQKDEESSAEILQIKYPIDFVKKYLTNIK